MSPKERFDITKSTDWYKKAKFSTKNNKNTIYFLGGHIR